MCSEVSPLALVLTTCGAVLVPGVFTVIHCVLLSELPEPSVAVHNTCVRVSGWKPLPMELLTVGLGSATSKTTAVPTSKSSVVAVTLDSITRLGGANRMGGRVSSTVMDWVTMAMPGLPPPIGPVSTAAQVTSVVPSGSKTGASLPIRIGRSQGSLAVIVSRNRC